MKEIVITKNSEEEILLRAVEDKFVLIHYKRGGKHPLISVWNQQEAHQISEFVHQNLEQYWDEQEKAKLHR